MNKEIAIGRIVKDAELARKRAIDATMFVNSLPDTLPDISHVSEGMKSVFFEISSLREILGHVDSLEDMGIELGHYYMHSSRHLALSFNVTGGWGLVFKTNDIQEALDFFTDGNCKLIEEEYTVKNATLKCTLE